MIFCSTNYDTGLAQHYLTEHTEPTEKDNFMNPSAASYLLIYGCPAYVHCRKKILIDNYEENWDILEKCS